MLGARGSSMTRFKYYFVTFLDVRFGRLDFKAFAAPRYRVGAPIARGASRRTVLVLFTHGSSGR